MLNRIVVDNYKVLKSIVETGRTISKLLNKNQPQVAGLNYTRQENEIRITNRASENKDGARKHKLFGKLSKTKRKRFSTRITRYSILGANLVIIGIATILITSSSPSQATIHSATSQDKAAVSAAPIDQLSSADIAVHVARIAALPEATAVTNQADSEATQLAVTASESKMVVKPQVVATSLKSAKDIITYTSLPGDTLSSLAAKYGITTDSIRWSNGLSSEVIPAGRQLSIPPVNGVVYVVGANDSVESLAQRYGSDKAQILADNDAEQSGIKAGQKVFIRGGIQPVVRASRAASASRYVDSFVGGRASYGYNGYDYGWCTWYVANKRLANGSAMPTNLGNAATWYTRASAYGLSTGRSPKVGAAVVTGTRGAGHVAFVERINEDGSIWVSEMNSSGQVSIDNPARAGGWGRVDYKLLSAGQANGFGYVY